MSAAPPRAARCLCGNAAPATANAIISTTTVLMFVSSAYVVATPHPNPPHKGEGSYGIYLPLVGRSRAALAAGGWGARSIRSARLERLNLDLAPPHHAGAIL